MKFSLFLLQLFLTVFGITSNTQASEVHILTPTVRQGQTILVRFTAEPKSVFFDGKAVLPVRHRDEWRVAIPLPLTSKLGVRSILTTFLDGTSMRQSVVVTPAIRKTIVLPVPPKLAQTPKELVKNIAITNTSIAKTIQSVSTTTFFSQSFGLPLVDNRRISSRFGEIRQTRSADSGQAGDERISHLGVDFVAPTGTSVFAINSGIISDAYTDPTYGKSVIINHGGGIYSLYLHLDSLFVSKSTKITKGTRIGTVGETGLASAPHLHLSIKINGQSVDPLQFIYSFR